MVLKGCRQIDPKTEKNHLFSSDHANETGGRAGHMGFQVLSCRSHRSEFPAWSASARRRAAMEAGAANGLPIDTEPCVGWALFLHQGYSAPRSLLRQQTAFLRGLSE